MVRHNELALIKVEEAIKIIDLNSSLNQKTEQKKIALCEGFVLSEDITSPINMPPFRQSAMDGYAINMHDSNKYSLLGEVKAGDSKNPPLKKRRGRSNFYWRSSTRQCKLCGNARKSN